MRRILSLPQRAKKPRWYLWGAVLALLCLQLPLWAQTPGFQGLGTALGAFGTFASGVSGDGSVVVGYVYVTTNQTHAFRWTASAGMQDLGTLGGTDSEAYAASLDGSIVVGRARNANNSYSAFRWTATGGMQDLGTLGPSLYSDATDVSADGSVVVGLQGQAYRWTASAGLQNLGPLGGGYSTALGVSSDGQVAVGYSLDANRLARAFRWMASAGMQDLGTVGGPESLSHAASANGSVVVGESRNKDQFWHASRWTAALGMQDLGTLGGPMSAAYDVSADASVIAGKSLINSLSSSERAFRWTTKTQMQDLKQELLGLGVNAVQNWILISATGVSSDGTTIVGYGLNPSKQWEAFRAVLPLP